mmetsp:Transcript_29966/g.33444  ORF Transcript_29966/g.33444 Transcript_29966/m.33444 type:complete len:85 (+) Transcript_29966:106-360(+)|eukprot:CAMPEP_0168510016 /NCGR_PEP_ID=MMETSP0405-20121227/1171_1 /TAXON_ID=498012 /ORGANISM="Trichosphaerium sp, Strain Am-I-7 wt" /LENGTH=84 /DNA_ID=CAMNT_0008527687 /DNA_START=79 /DNA_END=333 /DNA_ORIENTATION=-
MQRLFSRNQQCETRSPIFDDHTGDTGHGKPQSLEPKTKRANVDDLEAVNDKPGFFSKSWSHLFNREAAYARLTCGEEENLIANK